MRRRHLDVARDLERLASMQRLSWAINFPGRHFEEWVFRSSLESSASRKEVYVYEEDGELVAWLWMYYPLKRTGHVRHIQVDRSRWGQGIGRRVMYDAMRLCLERGCRYLTLAVTKSNRRAMTLYRDLGFEVTGDEGDRQRMRLDLHAHPPPVVQEGDDTGIAG